MKINARVTKILETKSGINAQTGTRNLRNPGFEELGISGV